MMFCISSLFLDSNLCFRNSSSQSSFPGLRVSKTGPAVHLSLFHDKLKQCRTPWAKPCRVGSRKRLNSSIHLLDNSTSAEAPDVLHAFVLYCAIRSRMSANTRRSFSEVSSSYTYPLMMKNVWAIDLNTVNEQVSEQTTKRAGAQGEDQENAGAWRGEILQVQTQWTVHTRRCARGPVRPLQTEGDPESGRDHVVARSVVQGRIRGQAQHRGDDQEDHVDLKLVIKRVINDHVNGWAKGNALNMSAAKARFGGSLHGIKLMTISKKKWTEWMALKENEYMRSNSSSCVHCNFSDSSIMFMIRHRTKGVSSLKLTAQEAKFLSYICWSCLSLKRRWWFLNQYWQQHVQLTSSPIRLRIVQCRIEFVMNLKDGWRRQFQNINHCCAFCTHQAAVPVQCRDS